MNLHPKMLFTILQILVIIYIIIKRSAIMKKKMIITILIIILTILTMNYNENENKKKDITYAAEEFLTSSFFNNYRLYKIDYYHLTFSDNETSIMEVQGIEYKAPHSEVIYKLNMKKNSNGLWTITKVSTKDPFKSD